VVRYTEHMDKKPINVYWAPRFFIKDDGDWTFLYPKPKTLFHELKENQSDPTNKRSYFFCPATSERLKKTLVVNNSMACSYEYSTNGVETKVNPLSPEYLNFEILRSPAVDFGPTFAFAVKYLFFADEPLNVELLPPYFHKPKYTNYGTVIGGEFDIGNWFRSMNFEVQMWENNGKIVFEENEPLFYFNFKTKRPVLLHRFEVTDKIIKYTEANMGYHTIFGKSIPLAKRYERFNKVGYREKILTEIKKNLIEEDPYKF